MSEPMQVWVARDQDGSLWCYSMKPEWHPRGKFDNAPGDNDLGGLPANWFPDLRPGECRRMRLVDALERGEEKA